MGTRYPATGNCPEYRELHEKMQDIMKQIDVWKEKINSSRFYWMTDNGEYIIRSYQEDEE